MPENIKILRITTVAHSIDLLLKGQLKYMKNCGFTVYIACSPDPEIKNIELREEVRYYPISMSRQLNPFKDLIALVQLIKLIIKLKPDIVHTHSPKAGTIGMLAAKFCNVRLKLHTVAGLPLMEIKGIKRRLLINIEKITYSFCDWVLPNSLKLMEFIEENIYCGKKLKIISKGSSNGIDLEYFNPRNDIDQNRNIFRKQYCIKDNEVVFIFVGRLANYKGINELVAAFKTLLCKYSIRLLLVGPFEEINPLTTETIAEIKSNKFIIATGHQKDIRPFLTLADIFVFPSYREGFPQALMQASAFNLPCVTTDINGCNEIIQDNFNGYLIPPKDVGALINACEILITDKDKRVLLGNNGRKYLQHFEQKHFWKALHDFYLEKLNN